MLKKNYIPLSIAQIYEVIKSFWVMSHVKTNPFWEHTAKQGNESAKQKKRNTAFADVTRDTHSDGKNIALNTWAAQ